MSNRTRVTGMNSGLDTESLVAQLVEAKSIKVKNVTKDQMSMKYKQDAWNDLNKKLKNLFSTVRNMSYQSSYMKKAVSLSDSSVASITASDTAMLSTQNLKINKLSKTAYLTGGKISIPAENQTVDGEKATSATKLESLGVTGELTIKVGDGETKTIDTTGKTIGDIQTELTNAGVNANFDAKNQRFYIGAKTEGASGDFTIGGEAADKLGLSTAGGAVKIDGQQAEIELNGVKYTSDSNVFEINGLTITAKAETTGDGVSVSTTKDTSAMYSLIKNFITEYSSLINEMDKMYGAKEGSTLKPLTDEEKAAMSDYEVEKWEEKLKETALYKDSSVRDVTSALTSIMSEGFEINGKKMYLFDFGVEAQSYTLAAENEKHALHIKGDADDSAFSSEDNKLKSMIEADPDAVSSFFTKLSQAVSDKMDKLSARVANTRSYGSFYDDVKMKADYGDYTTKIKEMEAKLSAYEDKWYDKFARMEKAMAKMQSSQNALSGLLGQ